MIRLLPLFTALRVAVLALATTLLIRATTVVPPQFETLVNESDYVVHVVAKNVTAEKRVTASGGSKIVTRVEFETLEVVAGKPSSATFTLEFLGGQVGDEKMTVGGMPRFAVGDEDILFVSGAGRSICPLYGMMHGRYRVEDNATAGRKIVTRSDGTPLQNTAQVATAFLESSTTPAARAAAAVTALAPADFIAQVRAAVRPDAPISRGK